MSFLLQEQVMFELLFDDDFRAEYKLDATSALSLYGLTPSEIDDFLPLRLDALALEADVRKRMILSQICTQAPLSFAWLSSFDNGFDILKGLLSPFVVRAPTSERGALLLQQLLYAMDDLSFFNAADKDLTKYIFQLELCFCKQLELRHIDQFSRGIQMSHESAQNNTLDETVPLRLAPLLGVNFLPLSYWDIKQSLCVVDVDLLWRELQNNPILVEQRVNLFSSVSDSTGKCIVSLPKLLKASPTDPVVDLHIVEMIDGFLPLLNKINSYRSLSDILVLFESAGANQTVIRQAQEGINILYKEACILK